MPSQKLRLDDLVVESFHTSEERGFNGTVQGYLDEGTVFSMCPSCGDSCGGTCPPRHTCFMDTTCAPEHTCNASCPPGVPIEG